MPISPSVFAEGGPRHVQRRTQNSRRNMSSVQRPKKNFSVAVARCNFPGHFFGASFSGSYRAASGQLFCGNFGNFGTVVSSRAIRQMRNDVKPKQKTMHSCRNCADTTIFLKSKSFRHSIGWIGSKSRSIAHSSLSPLSLSLSQCSHCDAPVSPSTVHTHAQRPLFAPHRNLIVGRDLLSSTKLWVVGTAELSPKNFHAGKS